MTFTHEPSNAGDTPAELTGHPVVDTHMAKVGTVTDVLFDDGGTPGWAVVKTGPLRSEHFVPLEQTYVDTDGRVVVPLTKAAIKRAPRVRRDHVLTSEARRELRDYYGIAA
jgi:uncharacterized protein YrrD